MDKISADNEVAVKKVSADSMPSSIEELKHLADSVTKRCEDLKTEHDQLEAETAECLKKILHNAQRSSEIESEVHECYAKFLEYHAAYKSLRNASDVARYAKMAEKEITEKKTEAAVIETSESITKTLEAEIKVPEAIAAKVSDVTLAKPFSITSEAEVKATTVRDGRKTAAIRAYKNFLYEVGLHESDGGPECLNARNNVLHKDEAIVLYYKYFGPYNVLYLTDQRFIQTKNEIVVLSVNFEDINYVQTVEVDYSVWIGVRFKNGQMVKFDIDLRIVSDFFVSTIQEMLKV